VLQSLGLSSDAWFGTAEASNDGMLSVSNPGDVMLGIGMLVVLVGTIVGLFGQAPATLGELRPAILPTVLLAVLSVGSMAFAYQIGGLDPETIPGSPSVASAQECPPGTTWHPVMDHCMVNGVESEEPIIDVNGNPICPDGFYWHPDMDHCMENGTVPVTPVDDGTGTLTCPDGYYWHPDMNHCMANGTTAGVPSCVPNASLAAVSRISRAPDQAPREWFGTLHTPVPSATQPPIATATPPPQNVTPLPIAPQTPVPTCAPNEAPECPAGSYWHPSMNHCMPNGTSPGTPVPPGQPTPVCPPGYYWHPSMNHCMPNNSAPTPTPPTTGTPVPPTPTPVCPPGYFWHPSMNHCMPTSETAIFITDPVDGGTADTDFRVDVGVTNASLDVDAPAGYHWHLTIDGVAQAGAFGSFSVDAGVMLEQGPHTVRVALYRNSADDTVVASHQLTFIALDEPDACQYGSVYNPADQHCELWTCPAPWVFNWATLHCDLDMPTETPTPTATATATPSCPDGYVWHPAMGHCMNTTCPAPWVFNWETLYCELAEVPTETPTPTPTPVPTPEPTPSCPDGYIWHPAMGHCMNTTCPAPWVFNWDTLYCELPPELLASSGVSSWSFQGGWRPTGYLWS
jgi:hypothetical protein